MKNKKSVDKLFEQKNNDEKIVEAKIAATDEQSAVEYIKNLDCSDDVEELQKEVRQLRRTNASLKFDMDALKKRDINKKLQDKSKSLSNLYHVATEMSQSYTVREILYSFLDVTTTLWNQYHDDEETYNQYLEGIIDVELKKLKKAIFVAEIPKDKKCPVILREGTASDPVTVVAYDGDISHDYPNEDSVYDSASAYEILSWYTKEKEKASGVSAERKPDFGVEAIEIDIKGK